MKKEKSKNLIVILGNGFDLAHGLKTRFSDFADYFLEAIIYDELISLTEKDSSDILKVDFLSDIRSLKPHKDHLVIEKIGKENADFILTQNIATLLFQDFPYKTKREQICRWLKYDNYKILPYLLNNSFLSKLYSRTNDNWFDIEQAYYKELVEIHTSTFSNNQKREKLIELNNNLSEIRDAFQTYLFRIRYHQDENAYKSLKIHFKERESVCFVNFNYTSTIGYYWSLKDDNDLKPALKRLNNIHIHGHIQQELVFGYGDDTDQYYQEMKGTKEKEFLRNFKTFEYLGSPEYRQVLNELAIHDNYDVLIIGHSLDTTDKTILNTILDTEKCQHIELLKRSDIKDIDEQNEYHFELHANLSRIFDKEADLREKVISSLQSVHFPIMGDDDFDINSRREKELYKKPEPPIDGSPSYEN